eukprot:CAMPEP_0171244942 /NCGR_PEP_ID=MMETSP0790-20130122/47140_1 /TAXON_ID=2925 /ORGANISM="Alexandrium catenella, Strain OF101" /LENGTH=42 /DNA_ID= /DNA_START= /DNA_END= /DNA_ORIENTATION=
MAFFPWRGFPSRSLAAVSWSPPYGARTFSVSDPAATHTYVLR